MLRRYPTRIGRFRQEKFSPIRRGAPGRPDDENGGEEKGEDEGELDRRVEIGKEA